MEIRTDNNIAYIVNFLILIIVLWLSKKCFLFLKNIQNKFSIARGIALKVPSLEKYLYIKAAINYTIRIN